MKISTVRFVVLILSVTFVAVLARDKKEEKDKDKESSNGVTTIQLDSARISAQNAEKQLSEKKKERLILDYEVTSKSTSASGK